MKTLSSQSFWPNRLALAATCASLLLGCSTAPKTPESVGKEMAHVLCAASNRQDEVIYARNQQVATEMKAGKIKTRAQLQARYTELLTEMKDEDIATITARTDSIVTHLDADFPRREDRLAVGRVIERYIKQCDSTSQVQKKLRPDLHLPELRAQLTGPDPTYDTTSDGPPPAPPVLQ